MSDEPQFGDPSVPLQYHLFFNSPPPPASSVPPLQPTLLTAQPTQIVPEEIEQANDTCPYCGLIVEDWNTHTCDEYLSDRYRVGDVFPINASMHALVLKNGTEITYMPIAPGQLRTLDIQEFDQQVKDNSE